MRWKQLRDRYADSPYMQNIKPTKVLYSFAMEMPKPIVLNHLLNCYLMFTNGFRNTHIIELIEEKELKVDIISNPFIVAINYSWL